MKQILATVSACALLASGGCAHTGNAPAKSQASVPLATASLGTYVETISATGRVGAPAGAVTKLSFALPGILSGVDVTIGEHVAAGQPLARIDTGGLSLAAQQAQADASAAAANQQQSAVDRTSTRIAVDLAALRRAESLYSAGVAPLKDVQSARAQLAADRAEASSASAQVRSAGAQAQSAQARAAMAQRDLYNGTLRSPIDGVITAIYKRPGESVDTATQVVAIAPGSSTDVTLDITASDAARVRPGDSVSVTIPGSDLHSAGRVAGVSPALDPATQAATVVVRGIPSGAPGGSAVQARIAVARDRGIIIPQSSIVEDPQTGKTMVFVQTQGPNGNRKFTQRTVTVAHSDGAQALISRGLRAGERVAAQGAFALLAPS
jgi:cobalt-zinc-cadmium efflux system membrane fusion protein